MLSLILSGSMGESAVSQACRRVNVMLSERDMLRHHFRLHWGLSRPGSFQVETILLWQLSETVPLPVEWHMKHLITAVTYTVILLLYLMIMTCQFHQVSVECPRCLTMYVRDRLIMSSNTMLKIHCPEYRDMEMNLSVKYIRQRAQLSSFLYRACCLRIWE